jgi:hypothetical protein
MTVADVARFALIVALGLLALITFLIAGTIVGLMWVEGSDCDCVRYPVGLYVLGLFGLLLLASLISEGADVRVTETFEGWFKNQREALIVGGIFLIAIILLLL